MALARRRNGRSAAVALIASLLVASLARPSSAAIAPHTDVQGAVVTMTELRPLHGTSRAVDWASLSATVLEPGDYELAFHIETTGARDAVRIPWCAGRRDVRIDGVAVAASPGPVIQRVGPGAHEVVVVVRVSSYERRVACGEKPRVGPATQATQTTEGLGLLSFASPSSSRGGGSAVVFVPAGHDVHRPGTLLVGLHPWNGSIWTYAAYAELLDTARDRDVILLMPSGLGNSLYTADAEDEVLRAIDALAGEISIDPRAVSIWGASMGGAGATTIGFHHPNRFASVTSFFGDSRYDLSTYVRALLPDEAAAHRVNALDVVDNARLLPVWLIHGENDRASPIAQSAILASALSGRSYSVRFDRVAGAGHAGSLVARFLPDVVARAASARVPSDVTRISYRSVRPSDTGAFGLRIVRESPHKDAFVDVERRADAVHVLHAEGVRAIRIARGSLATARESPPPFAFGAGVTPVDTAWDPLP